MKPMKTAKIFELPTIQMVLRSTLSLFIGATLAASSFYSFRAEAQSGPIEMDDSSAPQRPPPKVRSGSVVGRKAAQKYMGPHDREAAVRDDAGSSPVGPQDHYLALHLGAYVSDNAYRWGSADSQANVGDATVGLTYRIGEWTHTMDAVFRVDYSAFGLDQGTAGKLSILPMITFPEATSRFPIYLGAGAGLGIFTKQINGKSALSIDYQVVLGARFFEVIGSTGFFIEGGIKNSFFLLTDGQFNGTFVAAGPVFTF